ELRFFDEMTEIRQQACRAAAGLDAVAMGREVAANAGHHSDAQGAGLALRSRQKGALRLWRGVGLARAEPCRHIEQQGAVSHAASNRMLGYDAAAHVAVEWAQGITSAGRLQPE